MAERLPILILFILATLMACNRQHPFHDVTYSEVVSNSPYEICDFQVQVDSHFSKELITGLLSDWINNEIDYLTSKNLIDSNENIIDSSRFTLVRMSHIIARRKRIRDSAEYFLVHADWKDTKNKHYHSNQWLVRISSADTSLLEFNGWDFIDQLSR